MQYADVMTELAAAGSEQTRRTYLRHGVPEPLFGVSFAKLKELKKRLKKQHALACELWECGNSDARVLATMIADPARATPELLEAWCGAIGHHVLAGSFADYVLLTPFARHCQDAWLDSPREMAARVGWTLVSLRALQDRAAGDDEFAAYLPRLEAGLHAAPNRVREAMNTALIAIGIRSRELEVRAIATARRIGRVEVDHGDTACKTPDAEAYILKTRQRQRDRASRS